MTECFNIDYKFAECFELVHVTISLLHMYYLKSDQCWCLWAIRGYEKLESLPLRFYKWPNSCLIVGGSLNVCYSLNCTSQVYCVCQIIHAILANIVIELFPLYYECKQMVASWACIYRAFTLSSITKPLQLLLRQIGTRNKELFVFFKNIKYYNLKKIKK